MTSFGGRHWSFKQLGLGEAADAPWSNPDAAAVYKIIHPLNLTTIGAVENKNENGIELFELTNDGIFSGATSKTTFFNEVGLQRAQQTLSLQPKLLVLRKHALRAVTRQVGMTSIISFNPYHSGIELTFILNEVRASEVSLLPSLRLSFQTRN